MNSPAVTALARRADAGTVRLGVRDVAGLVLAGDMYGAPYDLLAAYLDVRPDRLRGIVARWRAAGYVATGRLGARPPWCWLTRTGLAVTGQPYTQARPAAARLAHLRAVLAVRLSLEGSPAYRDSRAWWRPERRIRAAIGGRATGHVPDAEVSWPDLPTSPYPGECWAIEAELTPKPLARTTGIMARAAEPHRRLLPRFRPHRPPALYPDGLPDRTGRTRGHRPRRRVVAAAAGCPGDDPGPAPRSGRVSIFWAYLQVRAFVWLLRMTGRLLLFAAVAALLVAAAPVTLVAAVALAGAWLRGWPPARLRRAAAWALPMTAVYLAGRAVQARTWQALTLAPVRDYLAGWHAVAAGQVVTAFVLAAPVAVPAGLAAASGLWAWRIYALDTGLSGKTATAPLCSTPGNGNAKPVPPAPGSPDPGRCRWPTGAAGS